MDLASDERKGKQRNYRNGVIVHDIAIWVGKREGVPRFREDSAVVPHSVQCFEWALLERF